MKTNYFDNSELNNIKYVVLENSISYDWDDYGVAADILYHVDEKKILVDFYGHGSQPITNKDNSIKYTDLVKNHTLNIDLKDIANALIENLKLNDYGLTCLDFPDKIDNIFFPCKVTRGKYKTNDGILLKLFVPNDYKNSRFNKQKAVVFFSDRNEIMEVSPSYVNLEQSEKYNVLWRNNILNYTLENMLDVAHLIAYRISYSACDTTNYRNGIRKILYQNRIQYTIDINNINYPKQKEREQKFNDFKTKKMNDLKIWADEKFPDKTENEKLEICKHTFLKYYSNEY